MKKIAAGGMGQVFLAKTFEQGFEKLVVLKRILPHLVEDEEFFTMFMDEARLAARLNHPNIAQIFDLGEERGVHYIVMEYVAGDDVRRMSKFTRANGFKVPLGVSLRIIADAAAGLDYAHKAKDAHGKPLGLVHRDISPQNILVGFDGGVKLIDFGVAKAQGRSQHTATGILKGKYPYMSPEQAEGEELDGRSDVFALGIVLWEMITEQRLFKGENDAAAQKLVKACRVPAPSSLAVDVPDELDAIVLKALAKRPQDRFQDALGFRLAIEEFVLARRIPASSAHVQAFMGEVYPGRIASEADPTHLDQLSPEHTVLDDVVPRVPGGTPSSRIGRARGLTTDRSHTGASRRAPVEPPPEPAAPSRSNALILAVGALALVAIAAVAVYQVTRTPEVAVAAPVVVPVVEPPAPLVPALRLCGSDTVGAELAPWLVESFLRRRGATVVERRPGEAPGQIILTAPTLRPPVAVSIEALGTATAFKGFAAGTCDVGMASRQMRDEEQAALSAAQLPELRAPATEHVIALDGIAVVVHPNNRIRRLDTSQVRDIFTGKITDWSRVGGARGPITIFARDDKSGTYDTFKHLVMGDAPLAASATRLASSDQLSDMVATEPSAIGFVGLAYVHSARAVPVGEAGLPATLPSAFTVGNESYLLSRRLYLYSLPKPASPLVTELITFVTSAEGQHEVRARGFVDLTVDARAGEPCDGRCPRPYAQAVKNAQRISLDFRFRPGSDELDSRASRDVDRLMAFLREKPTAKVMLFGFSDTARDPASNLKASQHLAEEIGAELEARGLRPAVVKGFGSAMPLSRQGSAAERNRRVEVWVDGA